MVSPLRMLPRDDFCIEIRFQSGRPGGWPRPRVEKLNRSPDGTDGTHALAAGFKARSGGQSGRSGGHVRRNGSERGKRDGKGRLPNQRQPQKQ